MSKKYRMVIGGLGDDAHSIGIYLLALGFEEAGFDVYRLGIRNNIKAFFDLVDDYDIFLISNKNGHAELYLKDFASYLQSYKIRKDEPKLWYLGGSLSVSESDFSIKKKFLNQGFTNVYPKPIGFDHLLSDIKRDIAKYIIHKKYLRRQSPKYKQLLEFSTDLSDAKWKDEYLFTWRKKVLEEWPTGQDIDSQTVVPSVSPKRTMHLLQMENRRNGRAPLLQPRTGVADIEEQILKLQTLEAYGSSISSVQLDATCRSKLYHKAAEAIHLSLQRRRSVLNGFPVPIYKVAEVSRLVNSVGNPFQIRGGGPDHRFTYEIALMSGISGLEGGALSYLLPYDKETDPISSILAWQYVDRLCGIYCEKFNVLINREYFGVLTAALIEPSLAIVVNILEAILSAQQGVRSISVGYAEQGNRSQDIAAIQVLELMVNKYLVRFGLTDCVVSTVFHQYMAAFPSDVDKSKELIYNSYITSKFAKADRIMIKTAAESVGIPSTQDNIDALELCKKADKTVYSMPIDNSKISFERDLISKQVDQLMNAILECGNGAVSHGIISALQEGIIDIPWSPNLFNKNQVMSLRDKDGAVRFIRFGNMPFSNDIKDIHSALINERMNLERDNSLFSLLEKDLTRIHKNDYLRWPLDNSYMN